MAQTKSEKEMNEKSLQQRLQKTTVKGSGERES
jgi:hypothetical protein